MSDNEEILKKLYYDPLSGFNSKEKLYLKAKKIIPSITLAHVKQFLDKQAVAQITKSVKQTKNQYNSIISKGVRNNFQCDLMVLPDSKSNKGYKYLLTCIDVYSRYVMAVPLKTKTGDDVLQAFKQIIDKNGVCKNLNCDAGKEFENNRFLDYCGANDITVWISDPEADNKNAVIERFHRTLRNYILRYTVASGKSYIDDLDKLLENYNTTDHGTTKHTAMEIWSGEEANEQKYKIVEYDFKVGDLVRKLTDKDTFDKKSSTPTYSKKVYTITSIEGNSYKLDDLKKMYKGHEIIHALGENLTSDYDKQNEEARKEARAARRLNAEGVRDYLGAGRYYL